jgi:hypothetical protein
MRTLTLYLYSTIRGRLRMRDAMTPEGEYARTTEWVSRRLRALYRYRARVRISGPSRPHVLSSKEASY